MWVNRPVINGAGLVFFARNVTSKRQIPVMLLGNVDVEYAQFGFMFIQLMD